MGATVFWFKIIKDERYGFSGSLRPLQNIYSLMKNVRIRHSGVGRNPLNSDKLIGAVLDN